MFNLSQVICYIKFNFEGGTVMFGDVLLKRALISSPSKSSS